MERASGNYAFVRRVIEDECLKAEIKLCPAGTYCCNVLQMVEIFAAANRVSRIDLRDKYERPTIMYKGRDLLTLGRTLPKDYGHNVARYIWSSEELIGRMLSQQRATERLDFPQDLKDIFRGTSVLKLNLVWFRL